MLIIIAAERVRYVADSAKDERELVQTTISEQIEKTVVCAGCCMIKRQAVRAGPTSLLIPLMAHSFCYILRNLPGVSTASKANVYVHSLWAFLLQYLGPWGHG